MIYNHRLHTFSQVTIHAIGKVAFHGTHAVIYYVFYCAIDIFLFIGKLGMRQVQLICLALKLNLLKHNVASYLIERHDYIYTAMTSSFILRYGGYAKS